ncbi:MAG: phytase [Salegentibacter sp.]
MEYHCILLLCLLLFSCGNSASEEPVPVTPENTQPLVITEATPHDTDDPAIWINQQNPEESIIFGTDKATDGGVYAFDLDGNILEEKSITDLKYPNNADVEYEVSLNNSTTDILAFTERDRHQIRVFSVPDMKPLDNGGLPVFSASEGTKRQPMGIALYKSPESGKTYAIVSRKSGPAEGYLHEYELVPDQGSFQLKLVRKFGNFSGVKEIEAIAVDDQEGFIYYSDEGSCIRKYEAEPGSSQGELDCFGSEDFKQDMEGIAIVRSPGKQGQIIISDQQRGTFNFYSRDNNHFLHSKDLGTLETDGCDAYVGYLNKKFPNGLFVAMNNERNFYFYDLGQLQK